MNNKQILWEKWVNPFEPLDKDPEFLDDISIEDFSEYAEWEDYEQQKEINEKNKEEDVSKMNTKAIITPMGVIPFNEGDSVY